ncbi:hypothetical protein GQ600_12187 [Phytophthora cactorum]|nr:hypothetical protein GQ600_12187 [Phytophthora cactorum]
MTQNSVLKPIDSSLCSTSGCCTASIGLRSKERQRIRLADLQCVPRSLRDTAAQTPTTNSYRQNPHFKQSATDVPTAGTPTTEAKTQTMQAQWTPPPQTWNEGTPATQAPSTNAHPTPTVTNAPVWTNVPAVESSGTVTPFTQTEMAQSPVLDTAANTPNSFSLNNGNQATNAAASGQEQCHRRW